MGWFFARAAGELTGLRMQAYCDATLLLLLLDCFWWYAVGTAAASTMMKTRLNSFYDYRGRKVVQQQSDTHSF